MKQNSPTGRGVRPGRALLLLGLGLLYGCAPPPVAETGSHMVGIGQGDPLPSLAPMLGGGGKLRPPIRVGPGGGRSNCCTLRLPVRSIDPAGRDGGDRCRQSGTIAFEVQSRTPDSDRSRMMQLDFQVLWLEYCEMQYNSLLKTIAKSGGHRRAASNVKHVASVPRRGQRLIGCRTCISRSVMISGLGRRK